MMNKIIIPSIFVAVLLTAVYFAIMPVEKASTVHTTITASVSRSVQTSLILDALPAGAGTVVVDTSPNGMTQAHIAAVLRTTDGGAAGCTAGSDAPTGVSVQAGEAGVDLESVIAAAHNTGITLRANIEGTTDDMCVFHRTITLTDLTALPDPDPTKLTDIVVINTGTTPLPDDTSITVTSS